MQGKSHCVGRILRQPGLPMLIMNQKKLSKILAWMKTAGMRLAQPVLMWIAPEPKENKPFVSGKPHMLQ